MTRTKLTPCSFALALALLLGASATAAANNKTTHAPADATTTLKVKLALLDKLGADSLKVDVDSDNGTVALSGTVAKRETAELATTIAKTVTGVSSVDNDLEVAAAVNDPNRASAAMTEATAEVKDAMLETRIRLALVDKLGADGFQLGTQVASGVVTLEFDNEWSAPRRQEAVAAARAVDGVTKVVSIDKQG